MVNGKNWELKGRCRWEADQQELDEEEGEKGEKK